MTSLIACIDNDAARINHVKQIICSEQWEKVFIVSDKKTDIAGEHILIDEKETISAIAGTISKKLSGRIAGLEVGLNIVCSSGKIHMAVLSALLKLGLGIRLVVATKSGIETI